MARICHLTGKRPAKGSKIWRSGKAKKLGGIGTHHENLMHMEPSPTNC